MQRMTSFDSPRLLIADARDDIYRLNGLVKQYVATTIYSRSTTFDAGTGLYTHMLQFGAPLPDNLAVFVRKVVGSLRSALDHAVYASAAALECSGLSSTKFPFGETQELFEQDIIRKCRRLPAGILTVLRDCKPYREGNNLLWVLNKLRNVKEHRLLVQPCLGGGASFPISIAGKNLKGVLFPRGQEWNATSNTLVFQCLTSDEGNPNVKLTMFITFGEVEGIKGAHVIPTLYKFASNVENCVTRIEGETFRLTATNAGSR